MISWNSGVDGIEGSTGKLGAPNSPDSNLNVGARLSMRLRRVGSSQLIRRPFDPFASARRGRYHFFESGARP